MDLLESIQNRRAVRKFSSKKVSSDKIDQVLRAIQWSPSWTNHQVWEIIVVQEPSTKFKIQECVGKDNPAHNAMVEAPVLLIFCAQLGVSGYYAGEGTKFGAYWFMYDLGLASQSACLMAHALGLGTVIVALFDHDKVCQILGVPKGYEVVTIVPLGYPSQIPSPPGRRQVSDFTHKERF